MSEDNLLLSRIDHTIWPLHARREKHVSLFSQSDESIHRSNGNIASIDFGSQGISIAWTTAGMQDITCLKLNENYSIVPTAILLKEGDPVTNENGDTIGITCRPESFGYDAQHNYPKLRNRDRQNYIYFERMKMRFERDKDHVNRGMKIYSDHREGKNGEWYLIEVIAFIICYLKNKLMSQLSKAGNRISKATKFDWVITVPTIWQARGKQMMREAGYLAGLCGGDEIKYLSYPTSSEIIPSKLSLVSRSEATALYCQQLKPENIAKYCKNRTETHNNPQRYIVIDIGDFAVDIAAHEVISETGEAKVILAVQNNNCGGMSVNREFARFFQKIVGEDERTEVVYELESAFPKLLQHNPALKSILHHFIYNEVVYELESAFPKLLQHNPALKSILHHFIYNEFETQKELFGLKSQDENVSTEISIKIPDKILFTYSLDGIKSRLSKFFTPAEADIEEDTIYFKSSKINDFFRPAIQGILHCIQKALTDLSKKGSLPTVIYLVGEFGGCKYVHQCIDEFLAIKYSDMEYSLIVPKDYKLAAVYGGILYKKKPAITSQCLNCTYPDHHKIEHLNHNEDGNQICDDDAFLSFLKKDDQVSVEDIVVEEILSDINKEKVISIQCDTTYTDKGQVGDPISRSIHKKSLKNKMEIMKGDVVFFELELSVSSLFAFVRGKVQYIGPVPSESEGIYFGIEIIDYRYRGKGTTDGRPHFTCGANNGVYVSIDKIVMKIEQDILAIAKGKRNNSNVQQPLPFVRKPTIVNSQGNGPYNNGPPATITRDHKEASLKEIATNQAVTVPDYKRQKEIIQPLLSQKFAIGDEWYLVNSKWLNQWKMYTGYNDDDDWYMYQYSAGEENANPGPIDNTNLFKNHTSDELKKDLMDNIDYSVIPKPAYDLLVSWYGLSRGSRHICRCVVAEFGIFVKCLIVEVYLCDLRLCIHPNINNIKLIPFSRADTVRKVHSKIIEIFEVPSGAETRVWKPSMNGAYVLSNVDQTLPDAGINGGQLIMLEIKNKHGQWPCSDLVITSKQKRILPPDNTSLSSTIPAELIAFAPSVEEYRAQKELLDQANKEKDQLMSAVDSLEAENKETIAKYEEQINKLTCNKEELVREKRQLETNLMSKEKELAMLTEIERESAELAKYFESEKKILKEKKASLKKENATLKREKVNLEGEKRKLEQEKETLEKDRSNLTVMKREKATLQNTLRDLHEKYHNLETENQLLRDVRQELQEKNQQLQAEQKKNQILQGDNKQLQGEKQQLQDEKQQLQGEKQQLQGEKQQLQDEKQQLQDEKQQLQDEKQQLQGEKQQLQAEQQVLRAKVSANEQSWKINHKDVKMTKQELGRGGWGVIWIGQFRGQKVAVKQLHEAIVAEHYLQLLHREINTMSQLRHPNLLQFIGAVLDDPSGNPMIVTEIMDVSLRGAYEKKQLSPLPVHIPLAIMRDVAVGLNYLHCLPDPIIHRDVSSANVLLESKGPGKWKTKISDFGSAKFARSAVTKAAGSIIYCAPEAFQSMSILDSEDDQILTPKMDVFSYGVLLCEVLTCRFPDQQVFREMLGQVRSQNHPYLHDLLHSCIKRNPQDRPNIHQVIQQLDKK